MSIVKMKRLRAIGLASQRAELLAKLLSIGCVEVTEPTAELSNPQWTALLYRDVAPLSEVKAKATSVNNALEALRKYAGVKTGLFVQRKSIREEEFLSDEAMNKALETAAQINRYVQQIAQAHTQTNRLNAQRAGLMPWSSLDLPLELKPTEHAYLTYGVCPAAAELGPIQSELAQAAPTAELMEVSSDKEQHYFVLACHREEEEQALATLRTHSFNTVSFKEITGTAAENILHIDDQLAQVDRQRVEYEKALAELAPAGEDLRICADRLNGEVAKAMVTDRLLTNGTVVFLQGWAPAPEEKRLVALLESLGCAWELGDPTEEEDPPILLKNNHLISSMNMVTEMYSLPDYRGIDPNPLIFPFFAFFYGFMFADMGYGLIMFLAGLILTKKFHPKGTIGNILQLAMVCGVTTMVCGFLTGGFFGDVIPVVADVFLGKEVALFAVISPLDDPMTVLILGIGIGCFQLVVGQCIHIYMGFRDGEGLDAVLDVVPWWIVFIGIAVFVLAGSPVVIILGALSLILTQGRHNKGILKKLWGGISSLYDITSWLSDILSYSRLMALMLATTVIASVVNMLGTLPANIIVFIPIFLFGHTFNLGINIIGTYVHAARLQYLEYFGKFYKDGGRAFQPLRYKTKYVDVLDESGKEVS